VVLFELLLTALAVELLVWVTGPSSPGLSMRMETLMFVGATWVDVAVASAFWVVGALWLDVCDWPEEEGGELAVGLPLFPALPDLPP